MRIDSTKIAVVIPTLGRTFAVHNLCLSLLGGTRVPDEIVIVDQTLPEERNAIGFSSLMNLCTQERVRYHSVSFRSLTKARNFGATQTHSEILIFLDDDVFIPPELVESYAGIFENGTIDAATGMILIDEGDDGTFKPLVRMPSHPGSSNMLRGGNFALRRDTFFRVGGLDERFCGACQHEDWDLAWRLYAQDAVCVWDPAPWVYHLALPHGGGRHDHARASWDRAFNVTYFYHRHPEALGTGGSLRWITTRRLLLCREHLLLPGQLPRRMAEVWDAIQQAKRAAAVGPLLLSSDRPHDD